MKNSKQNSPATVTRALTVHEPHAWLLASDFTNPGFCVKPVENRSWSTSYRGPVAIHAGSPRYEVFDEELGNWLYGLHPKIAEQFELPQFSDDPAESSIFHFGCFLGVSELFDCLEFDPDRQDFEEVCRAAGHDDWYDSHAIPPAEFANGRFCHLYRSPKTFTQPFPARGKLNYWRLDSNQMAAVAAAADPWEAANY